MGELRHARDEIELQGQIRSLAQTLIPVRARVSPAIVGVAVSVQPAAREIDELPPPLGLAITDYLSRRGQDDGAPDELFGLLNAMVAVPLWGFGCHRVAWTVWDAVTRHVLEWETSNGKRIHKGALYYFWAMTDLEMANIDGGFLRMHRALEEDKESDRGRGGTGLLPNNPALKFVTLDADSMEQAAFQYVSRLAKWVDEHLARYRSEYGHEGAALSAPGIGLVDRSRLRQRLLSLPIDVAFHVTYSVATDLDE